MGTEKRKSERTDVFLIVELRQHNKPHDISLAISTNLSLQGAIIESQGHDLGKGDVLDLVIKHPKIDLSAHVKGRIAWKKDAWYKCLVGIKFIDLQEEDKGALERLMSTVQDTTIQPEAQPMKPETEAMPPLEEEVVTETPSTEHGDSPHVSEVETKEARDATEAVSPIEVTPDMSETIPHAIEISGGPSDQTESITEEYEPEDRKTEPTQPDSAEISLTASKGSRDEKERSLKPLISVLLIIVTAVIIIKFEDISRELQSITSDSSQVTDMRPPERQRTPQRTVLESVHDDRSQQQRNHISDDPPSEEADKKEISGGESTSSVTAVEEPPEKDSSSIADAREKKDLPPLSEVTPDKPKRSIPYMITMTRPSSQSSDKDDSPASSPSKAPADIPSTKAAERLPEKPVTTARTSLPDKKPVEVIRPQELRHEYKPLVQESKKPSTEEVMPDMSRHRFVAYEEPFNSNKNGWDIFNTESSSAIIMDGKYRMESKLEKGSLINLHHHALPRDRDFQIEIYVTTGMEGKNQAYGLVFGARGILNNYVFKINSDGSYSIGKYFMGIWKELAKRSIKDGIMRHNATNVLKIVRMERKVYFYINNTYLDKYSIPSFEGNQVGFIVQGKTVMAVDRTRSLIESRQ